MPRAAKGASLSKARAASLMLPAKRFNKIRSAALLIMDLILKMVCSPGGHVLGGFRRLLSLSCVTSVDAFSASPTRCFSSVPASAT